MGVGAVGEFMDFAIQWQAFGDLLDQPVQGPVKSVEQAIGIDSALVEGSAGDQRFIQLGGVKTREQVLALHDRMPGQVVQVARHLVVHHAHQQAAPDHEQCAVECQQAAAGRAPALRRVQQ